MSEFLKQSLESYAKEYAVGETIRALKSLTERRKIFGCEDCFYNNCETGTAVEVSEIEDRIKTLKGEMK
jgi:hypothetical protein